MKKVLLLAVIVIASAMGAMAQNADFAAISALNSNWERKLYLKDLGDAQKAALIRYHIDEKKSQWEANSFAGLTQAQRDALDNLRDLVTATLVGAAKTTTQANAIANDFNTAYSIVQQQFTSGQITELNVIGNYDPGTFDFTETLYEDEVTGLVSFECAKGRICRQWCDCNTSSWCQTCYESGVCYNVNGMCGCLRLWQCDGQKNPYIPPGS